MHESEVSINNHSSSLKLYQDKSTENVLYRELKNYGNENFSDFEEERLEIVESDLESMRWGKPYIKIDYETALDLYYNKEYLDESEYS